MKAHIFLRSFFGVLAFAVGCFYLGPFSAFAANVSVSSVDELEQGTFTDTRVMSSGEVVKLQAEGTWNAMTWKSPDKIIGAGSAFTSDGTNIYVIRGLGDILFWRYNTVTDTWTTLANLPRGAYYGSELEYLNGYIYALFGGYQRSFARYSIEDNSWEILDDYPELVWQGASLSADDTNIYAITGNNTQSFYKYSVVEDDWNLLASPPATLRAGADLERYGDFIYTLRGNNTTTFYRYSISSNTWSTLANFPIAINEDIDVTGASGVIYVSRQTNTTAFYQYTISSNTWTQIANAPMTARYAGVEYVANDGYVYFFRGNSDYRFWKYNPATDSFVGPSDTPNTLSTGSDIIYHNGYLYAVRGVNTLTLYRLDVASNVWTQMADAPSGANFNDDTNGVVANGNLYLFRGSNTTTFVRYVTSSNTWETLATAPSAVRFGGAIAYPGSGNFLYATRGAGTNAFYRYDMVNNIWDDVAVADLPAGITASYGSSLVSDGTYVYFTGGAGLKRMYRFDIAAGTWSELAQLPYSPYYGSDATYDGNGHIFALSGNYRSDVWVYSIAENDWSFFSSFPLYGPTDLGAWSGSAIVSDRNGSIFITRANGRQDVLVLNYGANIYKNTGTWTSPVQDLSYVGSWGTLTTDIQTPGTSSILVQTRTSNDGVSWSNWESLSGGAIVSPVRRFFQLRATLVADAGGIVSPLWGGYSLDYTTDTNPPGNIGTVTAYSQQVGGEELTNGEEYSFAFPYFTWDEATDAETSVAGYYVYWGPTSNANPVDIGTFQTETFYLPNHGIEDGNNYLRIAVKDVVGNISSPVTVFQYDYIGVSPLHSEEVSGAELIGTAVGTSVTPSGIKLSSRSDGFWVERRLTPPTRNFGYGARSVAYVASENKMYALSGQNDRYLLSYDLVNDSWVELALTPQTVYYGGGVVEGPPGYLYAARGYNTTEFWKYSIASNSWDASIAPAPLTVGYGASMVFDGT